MENKLYKVLVQSFLTGKNQTFPLRNLQHNIVSFSLNSKDEEAKRVFHECMLEMVLVQKNHK
ncbi:hypothetical protein COL93_10515 [Bacillus toyonensis]|uniref:Uncharacterized protein n=1 Tax=Bacillus toyonensis TaxID=155322 RepID=A0A2B5XQK6_9BACI|nr:hypothetical protein COL93_10515 [Bacillus toyonensis]PHD66741.1 hypothetical protein COF40_20795 [Bacillus toyonensis]